MLQAMEPDPEKPEEERTSCACPSEKKGRNLVVCIVERREYKIYYVIIFVLSFSWFLYYNEYLCYY